jgi:hypothetical protein
MHSCALSSDKPLLSSGPFEVAVAPFSYRVGPAGGGSNGITATFGISPDAAQALPYVSDSIYTYGDHFGIAIIVYYA